MYTSNLDFEIMPLNGALSSLYIYKHYNFRKKFGFQPLQGFIFENCQKKFSCICFDLKYKFFDK